MIETTKKSRLPQPGELWKVAHAPFKTVFWADDVVGGVRDRSRLVGASEIFMVLSVKREAYGSNSHFDTRWEVKILIGDDIAYKMYDNIADWQKLFVKAK